MLTLAELAALESLLERARIAAGRDHVATAETITPGDVVQLRPGTDDTWESSLMLVCRVDGIHLRAQVLRPHRSGCPEAWYPCTIGEVARVGRAPYPQPARDIRHACYAPPCPLTLRKPPTSERSRKAGAAYRAKTTDMHAAIAAELVTLARKEQKP